MAKNKPQKDMFNNMRSTVTEDTEIGMNLPEITERKKPEPVVQETTETRKVGRPRNPEKKQLKYVDMTGIEDYVTFRAKKEKMFVNEFLRYLVLKDAKEHMDLFEIAVDKDNEKIMKELAAVK